MEASTFNKPSVDGTERIERGTGDHVATANPNTINSSDFLLRLLAIVLLFLAIILLAASKQTKTGVVTGNLVVLNVEIVAKWQYLSALVYFMVVNVIAFAYSIVYLVLSLTKITKSKGLKLIFIVLDLVMLVLMFTANGAAIDSSVLLYNGNSKVGWTKICNLFGHSCRLVAASISMSMIGSLSFLLLIILSIVNPHR
ncbi:hypothetical protein IFM89_028228 [Coptis chinensis]|uniref:CASP-like protein n=1 Tax=Coptis chinensis TaxID=261450 RepID=A0A835M769_9MAGN|nr:hypothetical protein IFM89_028228 [Coptis chinensis]